MRCFIGIQIPKSLSQSLINEIFPFLSFPGARIVPSENLHLTLKFLGQLNESEIKQVKEQMQNFQLKNFEIQFKGIGFFPSENYARIVYVPAFLPKDAENSLKELCSKIRFGEPFSTLHLTVARVSSKCDFSMLKKNSEQKEFFSMHADEIILYQSVLAKPHSIYKKLYSKRLQ